MGRARLRHDLLGAELASLKSCALGRIVERRGALLEPPIQTLHVRALNVCNLRAAALSNSALLLLQQRLIRVLNA